MKSMHATISKPQRGRLARRAFTLIEMITALVIVAFLSSAVMVLVAGSAKTSLYVNTSTDATWQIENACRRITHNLRTASALTTPTTTTATSTLTTVTQQDPGNGNATYSVTYTLSGTNLKESDSRYNGAGNTANTIATNVTAFTVTRQSVASPVSFVVTITIGTTTPTTRTFTVYCRNL